MSIFVHRPFVQNPFVHRPFVYNPFDGCLLSAAFCRLNNFKINLQYALNISLNFLCNLRKFPGAVDHIVAVVFDSYSHQILKESFTDIGGIVYWDIPALVNI